MVSDREDYTEAVVSRRLSGVDEVIHKEYSTIISTVSGVCLSEVVPTDKIWMLTSAIVYNASRYTELLVLSILHNDRYIEIEKMVEAPIAVSVSWTGEIYLEAGDKIAGEFIGLTGNNYVYLYLHAVQMNKD